MKSPLLAALPLALAAVTAAGHTQDVVSVTRRASPAVVTLHTYNSAGRELALGSGFFLPDGRIVTNRHVVEGAARVDVVGPQDRKLGSVTWAEAISGQPDLAVLPRVGAPPATLPLATRLPEAGESVVVIGAPEGLSNTVSTGIVSAIRPMRGRTYVQISAPISHGSSGGPVLNLRGEVIGVSVLMLSEGQNLNFAIPASDVAAMAAQAPGRLAFTGSYRGGGNGGSEIGDLSKATHIAAGQTVRGRLTETSFERADGSFADPYVYQGHAGERITVTLSSNDFDSWLVIDDPNGPLHESDDDSGGGLDSRLTVTLPHDGPYVILANTVSPGSTGSYTLTLTRGDARAAADTGGHGGTIADIDLRRAPRISAGQTVSGNLTTNSFRRSDNSYADPYVYHGRAGEQITVTLRSGDFDAWLVVDDPNGPLHETDDDSGGGTDARLTVTLPHDGDYVILANTLQPNRVGRYTLSVQSGGGGGAGAGGGKVATPQGGQSGGQGFQPDVRNARPIAAGQTVSGRLTSSSFHRSDNSYADAYVYNGRAGERITVTLRSSDFDAWLVVDDPNGPLHETDDDSGGGTDARLTVTLPHDGQYLILANTLAPNTFGSYTLSLESGGGGGGGAGTGVSGKTATSRSGGSLSALESRDLPWIRAGQVVTGRLTAGSFRRDDGSYADGYAYQGRGGETITVTLRSSDFDAWLVIDDPNGPFNQYDDDSGGGTDSRLTVTLPHDGRYVILANSVSAGATGAYTLIVQRGSP